nr:Chain P, Nrf2 cyclic peptide,c[GAPETGE] [synthetic construct]
GAPETGE